MKNMNKWTLIWTFVVATNCAPTLASPANLGELTQQLRIYADDGEYERDLKAAGDQALEYLNAHSKSVQRPALVLDIDETSLSNLKQLEASQFSYFPGAPCDDHAALQINRPLPCGALAWDGFKQTPAIEPTRQLYLAAVNAGVEVFFITGRHDDELEPTFANLMNANFTGVKRENLILKQKADPPRRRRTSRLPARVSKTRAITLY